MSEELNKEQLNPPEPEDKGKPDGGKTKPVEFSPEQQEVFNRELAEMKRRERLAVQHEIDAEKERLAKEAREAALLEKENFKQLAEDRAAELELMRKRIENQDLDAKTDTLLANAQITDTGLRELVKSLPADLEKRAAYITTLNNTITGEAERRVAERLHMPAPSQNVGQSGALRIKDMSASDKAAYRERIGDAAFVKQVQEEKTVSKK
jgi:hypothetical protein